MKGLKTEECLGYSLFVDELKNIPFNSKLEINTVNQYSYCIAEEDKEFQKALAHADILLPDGIGMVWATRFLKGKKIKKIAGADLHDFLLHKLNETNGSCFYLGASEDTLTKIEKRLKSEFPNISVASYSPPYKSSFDQHDSEMMVNAVNAFRPDVLFVGMTAPKQEKWSHAHKENLNTSLICSIGAVFDFYAGTVRRPSKIWINLGFEWLGRLLNEPKRMWKRYIYYGIVFLYYLIKEKIKGKPSIKR
ncbi:glycosyltransferase [Zobellia sp. OII3]|uniref:WecB/TagA/CpsF family glycosyltransferase n=1 Tax=Zobellia sp. OII3 TaxID=2034520 RepID=UPI000B53221C|nr:WecB/TagA/CpsF family glycosyltransferase [Zobellia sp. OII3]OWW26239.1 glycosyltransferase [Zobellia sp. OII3]